MQWGLAYLAGAWLVLQVMDVLGELFGWPLGLQRTVFAALVVGFFAALVVAWFHGERGHQRITGMELVALAGVLGLGGLGLAVLPGAGGDELVPGISGGGDPEAEADPRPSLAVLPFRDLRPDSTRSYFADGVHEEIIAQLARIRGLRVISRTSVMHYANVARPAGEIARELGVEALLEGGVRHSGDSVRITATLIDARRDEPLWSGTYDEERSAIFAIQEDVAREIVRALSATLTPDESRRLGHQPTESPTAYELYLLSRHSFHRFGPEGLARSLELAEQAIAQDPAFAPAWLMVGRSSLVTALGHSGVGESPEDEMQRARSALQRALELDPGLAEARAVLAILLATYDYDVPGALRESGMAVASAPGDATAAEIHGLVLSTAGRDDEAIAAARRSVDLDPLAPIMWSNLGWVLVNARHFDEAAANARRALAIDPDFHDALTLLGRTAIRTGRFHDAIAAYRRGAEVSGDNPEDLAGLAHALARLGEREQAREILGGLVERARYEFVSPLHVGYGYLGLGDDEEALTWFERAVAERGGWNVWLPRYPEARHLHDDPRFRRLVERMGLTHLLRPAGAD